MHGRRPQRKQDHQPGGDRAGSAHRSRLRLHPRPGDERHRRPDQVPRRRDVHAEVRVRQGVHGQHERHRRHGLLPRRNGSQRGPQRRQHVPAEELSYPAAPPRRIACLHTATLPQEWLCESFGGKPPARPPDARIPLERREPSSRARVRPCRMRARGSPP